MAAFDTNVLVRLLVWDDEDQCQKAEAAFTLVDRLTFADTGVTVRSSRGFTTVEWSEFHKWRAGTGHILLYLNSAQYWSLPRRFFPDEQSLAAVEQQLRATVGEAG